SLIPIEHRERRADEKAERVGTSGNPLLPPILSSGGIVDFPYGFRQPNVRKGSCCSELQRLQVGPRCQGKLLRRGKIGRRWTGRRVEIARELERCGRITPEQSPQMRRGGREIELRSYPRAPKLQHRHQRSRGLEWRDGAGCHTSTIDGRKR